MARPSNRIIREKIIRLRDSRGWNRNGALRLGYCLWTSQELTAQFGVYHEQPSAQVFYYAKKAKGEIHHQPRVGDIALWVGGSHGYGHAAVVTRVKHGVRVMSTDILGGGSVRICPIGLINQRWGQKLVGFYTPPGLRGPAPHHSHHPHKR
jgi:hypothetical protein